MKIKKLNEEINQYTLSNGLKVYMYYNPDFTSTYANYTLNFGSIDTDYEVANSKFSDPLGIAHYLEHLMFVNGEADYFDYFSELGANSNAYTSFNQTSYLVSFASNLQENLSTLIEMVQTLKIDEQRVKKEFGVIKEEIEMYNSKPNFVVQQMIFKSTFTTNFQYDIAGSLESIKKISYTDIKRLFELFYAPSNATLFIATNEKISLQLLEQMQVIKANLDTPHHFREIEGLEINSKYDYKLSNLATSRQTMVSLKFPVSKNVEELMLADISFEIFIIWLTSDLNPNYRQGIESGLLNETFNGFHMGDKYLNCMIFKIHEKDGRELLSYINEQASNLNFDMIETIKRKKIGSEIKLFNNPEHICEYGLDLVLRDIDIDAYFDYLYTCSSRDIKRYIEKMLDDSKVSIQILSDKEEGA